LQNTFQELLASYDYSFPQELIAKEPASPRDAARLLVYDRKKESVHFDTFKKLTDYLPKNAVLVMNQTKVIPAKLTLKKVTGGAVSALLLSVQPETITVLASNSFQNGDKLIWQGGHSFTVTARLGQEALLKPSFPMTQLKDLLNLFGETPLPPYMKDSPLTEERRRSEYQTVFAEEEGSVAAPTAGLHFTKELMKACERSGCDIRYLTLHVHLGTFAPLSEEQWSKKTLHSEYYYIDDQTVQSLNAAKAEGRPIVAVGTTTVRTLESASDGTVIVRPSGSTDLFLTEDSSLHFTDHLITNFHVPRSSLLMLVSAFTGRETLLSLYKKAIEERMRLFSFGDGMLIL
jgi:S-adenosylmethionine:tRNA ribosyltransferase-isomerase